MGVGGTQKRGRGEAVDCGYHEKRRRLALWPAGGFLWGGQSRILLFITWNIKLPTLPRGTVRPPWILTTSTTAGDGHTIPLPSLSLFLSPSPSFPSHLSFSQRSRLLRRFNRAQPPSIALAEASGI